MAKNDNLTDFLTDVANAIRAKKGISGKINPQNFSSEIASISTGSGGGDAPTPSPSEPLFPVIGDGKTYLYIKIAEKGRMTVPLYFSQTVANGVTIDWGDGSASESLSGTGIKNTSHVYAVPGDYVISLNPVGECTLGLGNGINSSVLGPISNNGYVYCNMLEGVEIGNNVVTIGKFAFKTCRSLKSVVIPEGVTSIEEEAFRDCHSLASIVIPEGVTSIGKNGFYNCYSLASIVLPEGIEAFGNGVFYYCYSLTSVVIPESMTSIGSYSFINCYSLRSVVIPKNLPSMGEPMYRNFYNCCSLKSVVIPESMTSIGDQVFYNCNSLASVVIPEGVTSIGSNAFYNCYSLASIVIPEGVTSIGTYAFRYCYGMAIYDFSQCTAVPTLSNTNAFSSIPSDCKMVIPDDLYDTWTTATNWSTYASKMIKASEFNG